MNIRRLLIGSAVLLGFAAQPVGAVTIGPGDAYAFDFYFVAPPYDPSAGYSTTLYLSGFDAGDEAFFDFYPPNSAGPSFGSLSGPLDLLSFSGVFPILDPFDFAWWQVIGEVGTFEVVRAVFEQDGYQIEGTPIYGAIPIPTALPLLASGLSALGLIAWRRKNAKYSAGPRRSGAWSSGA